MKIQLDIPDELNKKLKIVKIIAGKENLQETILGLLEDRLKNTNVKDILKFKKRGENEKE